MPTYVSPVYVYRCRSCDKIWHMELAPGFGGPHCPSCFTQTAVLIARNYRHGKIVEYE